jgi:acetyltransferase-like isoleucine patch superfamily enzyme
MGSNVWISQFVYIDELHPDAVTIEDNVTIGLRTSIFTHMYWGPRRPEGAYKEVVIEKNAFIGPHCLILPGVRVGEAAVVKGGSVLTRSVPAYTFWGSPEPSAIAKVTVPLTAAHSYDEFVRGLRPIRKLKTK